MSANTFLHVGLTNTFNLLVNSYNQILTEINSSVLRLGANTIGGVARANTGTVTTSGASTTVNGSGTKFTEELQVGDVLTIGGENKTILTIPSNLVLTVNNNFSAWVANTFTAVMPANTIFLSNATFTVGNSLANTVITAGSIALGNATINANSGIVSIQGLIERANVAATAATGTINFNAVDNAFVYFTTNAAANWTLNLRGNSTQTLAATLAVGQSFTCAFAVPLGATPYYASAHQIDGNSVTPLWQNGVAPSAVDPNSTIIYSYTVVKTAGTPTYTVFGSVTKFA